MTVLTVGRIDKPHGVRGEVLVSLVTNRLERVEPGTELLVGNQVLKIRESRPHQGRWIVRFEQIHDRNAAETYRGMDLTADAIDDPDELWVHELIGAEVVDTEGESLGTIAHVEPNPASDLLILEDDGIVPLTFFVERRDDGTIVVDPPEGLFDPIDASGD